jgi:putative membrane protein
MLGKLLALISTSCTVISAICMAFGWVMIKRGKQEAHQRLMITSVIFAALFFILYMARTVFVGNTEFGGPAELKPYYTAFLTLHIILTIVSPVLAVLTLYYAYKKRFDKHPKLGRWTARIWFVTAVTGLLVYLLLFVIFPPGPTANLFRAYWGF